MFSEEEREIFIEYSLQNENNLKISINSALSFKQLRERIIRNFIKLVETSLRNEINKLSGDWELSNSISDNVFEHWKGIFVHKTIWGKQYQIGFSSEKYDAKEFIIGVKKSDEKVPHINGLLEKLNNEYRQGSQSDQWNWYQWLEQPYLNWNNEEALVKMYRSESVEYFTKHILSIINVATGMIDLHIQGKNLANHTRIDCVRDESQSIRLLDKPCKI